MIPRELRTRLALDARILARLRSPHLGSIRGYASPDRLARRAAASDAELAAGMGVFWVVEYRLPMLAGPGRPLPSATAVVNVLAGGDYPFTAPAVTFVTRPFPWCGHVNPSNGAVCLGDGWARARGQVTLAHLVVHLMRLVNFDEPATDDGNDAEALRFGREALRGRPLHPDLVYPALPADILHGVPGDAPDSPAFSASAFIPRGAVARVALPHPADPFVPRGDGYAPSAGLFLPRGTFR